MKTCALRHCNLLSGAIWLLALQAIVVLAASEEPPPGSPAPAAAPLWLGDPGVDPAKAREASHAKTDAAQQWWTAADLADYDHVGLKNPRWDDDARKCIELAGSPTFTNAVVLLENHENQKVVCARALKNGCNDPLILFMGARLGVSAPGAKGDALARVYTEVERTMFNSSYPPLRKFFAAARAVEFDIKRRRGVDNTIGRQGSGYSKPAASWAEGTDVKVAFQHARNELELILKDPAISPLIYLDSVETLFFDATSDPIGRAEVLVPLAEFFESDALKNHRTVGAKLVEGRFWMDYAWDARGGGYAGTVSGEGWKLFGERLEKAASALEEAWKLDPGEAHAPSYMITVTMGQGGSREEMEKWFRRAMDARPNDYAASMAKMLFLEPKWGGSEEAVVEFGRQCYETQDWSTRMPMLLLSAHERFAHMAGAPLEYWKQPEVWADLHKLYVGYLAFNPKSGWDRTAYAVHAAWAEDWKTAHEQFEQLGDKPDENMLDSLGVPRNQYEDMRRRAAEHKS